jgi:hypothetical protein
MLGNRYKDKFLIGVPNELEKLVKLQKFANDLYKECKDENFNKILKFITEQGLN